MGQTALKTSIAVFLFQEKGERIEHWEKEKEGGGLSKVNKEMEFFFFLEQKGRGV